METAFYCVSSSAYFLGAVAMVNSLRLLGHTEPIYLLDAGLDRAQRRAIESEVRVVDPPGGLELEPFMAKAIAPLAAPAEVSVLIDVDMIATRRFDAVIERAREGRAIAPALPMQRFFPEWGELRGLGPARRGEYVTSGLVFLGGEVGRTVVELLGDLAPEVEIASTFKGGEQTGYPLHYADQDLLNAILSTAVPAGSVETIEEHLVAAIPFSGIEVRDQRTLACVDAQGRSPYALHHVFGVKPWLEVTPESAYSTLLRRCLSGPDLALRLPRELIPPRLRSGPLSAMRRAFPRLDGRLGGSPAALPEGPSV
jgi:hypothetical protein